MFHFHDEGKINPTFQAVKKHRLKQDHPSLLRSVRQHGPKLPKLTRKGLALYMAMFYAVNPRPVPPKRRAKTREEREIQHKAVVLGMTTGQLAKESNKHRNSIRKTLLKDCECHGRGPGAVWSYIDAGRLWMAKRKVREHRKLYREGPVRSCPHVALPFGPVDRGTLRELMDDPLIFLHGPGEGRSRKTGTVSVANVPVDAVDGSVGLGKWGSGPPLMAQAVRAMFLNHKVEVAEVNGYPAFVWKNKMHVFFHEFNWLRAHGLWAKPWHGERMHIHHVNGDRLDCRPRNLVLLTEREHHALHSRKRRGG